MIIGFEKKKVKLVWVQIVCYAFCVCLANLWAKKNKKKRKFSNRIKNGNKHTKINWTLRTNEKGIEKNTHTTKNQSTQHISQAFSDDKNQMNMCYLRNLNAPNPKITNTYFNPIFVLMKIEWRKHTTPTTTSTKGKHNLSKYEINDCQCDRHAHIHTDEMEINRRLATGLRGVRWVSEQKKKNWKTSNVYRRYENDYTKRW